MKHALFWLPFTAITFHGAPGPLEAIVKTSEGPGNPLMLSINKHTDAKENLLLGLTQAESKISQKINVSRVPAGT